MLVRRTLPALAADERIDGKRALVTGAASGLGFATSVELARRGAHVVMLDKVDLAPALHEARRRAGRAGGFDPLRVDLGDMRAVADATKSLGDAGRSLDLLVSNAGVVSRAVRRTAAGLDEMFAVNYLAPFALVRGLLGYGAMDPASRPRFVFVASEAHRWASGVPFDELARERDPALRRVLAFYGEHKLLLVTFVEELGRRLAGSGAHVSSLCPGAMNTRIARDAPLLVRPVLRGVMRAFFQSPEAAAEPVVYLACARAMEGRSGVYLHKMRERAPDPRATDAARGAALWAWSEALLDSVG